MFIIIQKQKKIAFFEFRMGHISSTTEEDPSQLKLSVDSKQPVKQDLKHLLNWSLSQIREIYAPFRRRKGSPLLTRSEFLRFVQLSRITSFHVYDCITKNQLINVFQILAILVMGAYTNYIYKLQFLFNIFDLKCKKKLSFSELILSFKSIIRGFCFLTGQPLPQNHLLQKFGHTMFSKADLNNDQLLQIGQIVGWLETTSTENLVFFKLFQPPLYGKEDYHIFNSFVPYTQEEVNVMHTRLNKVYCKEKLLDEDFLLLKPIVRVRVRGQKDNKQGRSMNVTWTNNSFYKDKDHILNKQNNHPKKHNDQTPKSPTMPTSKPQKQPTHLPSINPPNLLTNITNSKPQNDRPLSPFQSPFITVTNQSCINFNLNFNSSSPHKYQNQNQNQNLNQSMSKSLIKSKYHQKKKFQNIIIIKGRTITKKEVFDLRQYFDGISCGKKYILIQDFIQNFNQDQYNHMKSVAASLFNFLDKKQSGKIHFPDLVTKLYPNLSLKHLQTISQWSQQYNRNFNLTKKIKTHSTDQLKKRVLPKTCIPRLQELFAFFDEGRKGFVDIGDLERVLGGACTKKEIEMLFEQSDGDCDGKLGLREFVHVLLPMDLEIQGLM